MSNIDHECVMQALARLAHGITSPTSSVIPSESSPAPAAAGANPHKMVREDDLEQRGDAASGQLPKDLEHLQRQPAASGQVPQGTVQSTAATAEGETKVCIDIHAQKSTGRSSHMLCIWTLPK